MTLATSLDAHSRTLTSFQAQACRPARRTRNLFLSIVDAIGESNRRKAEREIARYIARNGGHLTDRLEHDIAQRFSSVR